MFLADVLSSAGIALNDDVIAKLEEILTEQSTALGESTYGNLKLTRTSFGDFDRSGSLDWHHDRAHRVVYEVVVALTKACADYAGGVKSAALVQSETDEAAAADLKRQADRVVAADSTAYDQARNHQPMTPEPDAPDATAEGSGE